MKNMLLIVLLVGLIFLGLVLVPLMNIWALNTLFGFGIQYSIINIAAMFWLSVFMASTFSGKYIKS